MEGEEYAVEMEEELREDAQDEVKDTDWGPNQQKTTLHKVKKSVTTLIPATQLEW